MERVKQSRGFTLIELLVVIAIIGLLASIILASLNTARQRGRDAKRIADIRDIQNALELYDETCKSYPNSLSTAASNNCPGGITFGSFMVTIPVDPYSANSYLYTAFGSGASCSSYHLGAELELAQTLGSNTAASNATKCTGGAYTSRGNGIGPNVTATNGDFAPECAGSSSCSSASSWVYDQSGS
jgi:general secretion pathway protein G